MAKVTQQSLLFLVGLTLGCQQGSVDRPSDEQVRLTEAQEKLILRKPPNMKGVVRVSEKVTRLKAGPTGPVAAPEDVAEVPSDALVSSTGLASKVLEAGKGEEKPGPKSKVIVHYSGWTPDGQMFDSSVSRGQAAEFQVSRVILGLTEGLQLMRAGEKRRFWIPAKLGYAEHGGSATAPAGELVFDIELIDIK